MPRRQRSDPKAIRFGAIIRRLREARGWTIIQLARRAGMNPTYVGILEHGDNMPTLGAVIELAIVLGANPGEIVNEVAGERNPS